MKTLYVLLGPTAVGKTERALTMAEEMGSPILSADSRQIFRGLEIGTAAPTAEQRARVHHYFVGTLQVGDYYSAARYEADALALIDKLFREGHDSLLMTGGCMLYIDAVCQGIDALPTIAEPTRVRLRERLKTEGLESLFAELQSRDPVYAAQVDPKNPRRIVHALEICEETGTTYTALRRQTTKTRPFDIVKIGLRRPREELFARINRRVETMMEQGLLDEARRWYPHRELNALNTVGYKELFAYFDGHLTLDEAVARIQKNTRVYAKKQMTWWAKDESIIWKEP